MTLLVFGVVRTDQYSWTSPVTVTTLAVATALLAAFSYVERTTAREPLIRLGLFANRSVAGANAYNFLVGAAMASAFSFVSFYLQRVLGTGPALTGIMFLPFALGVVAGSALAIKLGYRLAPRTLLVMGGLLTAAGFAWFGLISPDGAFVTDVLGPSIVATVAHNRTGQTATPGALNAGYAVGLTLSAALLVAAVLIALTVLRRASPAPPVERAERNAPLGAVR